MNKQKRINNISKQYIKELKKKTRLLKKQRSIFYIHYNADKIDNGIYMFLTLILIISGFTAVISGIISFIEHGSPIISNISCFVSVTTFFFLLGKTMWDNPGI